MGGKKMMGEGGFLPHFLLTTHLMWCAYGVHACVVWFIRSR